MTKKQRRRYYRIFTGNLYPVIVTIGKEKFSAIDLSKKGVKVKVDFQRLEWEIGEILDISIDLVELNEKPILVKGKICYTDNKILGLSFEDISSSDEKKIEKYLLKITKDQGIW